MSNPVRPPVAPPARPTAPVRPPGASVPAPVAPVAPTPAAVAAPVATPPVAASVASAPSVVAPVAAPIVPPAANGEATPTVAVAATTEKKKRGRKAGAANPFHGLFAWEVNAAGETVPVMDNVGGQQVQKRIKLDAPVTIISAENPNGFDFEKMDRLRPADFKKAGDFYRSEAAIYTARAAASTAKAAKADEGKLDSGRTAKQQRFLEQNAALIKQLRSLMTAEGFAEYCAANDIEVPADVAAAVAANAASAPAA